MIVELLVFVGLLAVAGVASVWVGIIIGRRLDTRLARGDGESDDVDDGSDD